MNYKLIIPSGQPEITIGMPTGSVTLKNGQILPESNMVLSFPHLFKKVVDLQTIAPSIVSEIDKKVDEFVEKNVEPKKSVMDLLREVATPKIEDTTKRKAGRPKKIF
jgi:hypothetical protein